MLRDTEQKTQLGLIADAKQPWQLWRGGCAAPQHHPLPLIPASQTFARTLVWIQTTYYGILHPYWGFVAARENEVNKRRRCWLMFGQRKLKNSWWQRMSAKISGRMCRLQGLHSLFKSRSEGEHEYYVTPIQSAERSPELTVECSVLTSRFMLLFINGTLHGGQRSFQTLQTHEVP